MASLSETILLQVLHEAGAQMAGAPFTNMDYV